ncbi:XRE family transcriptional regulator [Dorea sp. OM07-5]|uniref:helix-turn-helix domain-containing protein n=1 Tax=Dorea sp. OM07-5 TaxID=2293100 RepID=UPI000E4D2FAB|nr:helix-turn-helix transcriptional regulator [Dorea sp. OM07-5]RHU97040.1 XRE family transcriptional regulator [Dorea sp. OM07-5]
MSNIQLANNLRFLRTKHKLTQDDLSSLLNISRQAYSNYETSKRTPDLDSLLHISRFYRISIDELVLDNLQSTYHTSALKTGEEYIQYVVMAKEKNTGNSIYLSREELDFIIKYRALSEENKQILAGFLSNKP